MQGDFEGLAAGEVGFVVSYSLPCMQVKRSIPSFLLFLSRRGLSATYVTGGLGVMVTFLSWKTSASAPQFIHSMGFDAVNAGDSSDSSMMTVTRSGFAATKVEKTARGAAYEGFIVRVGDLTEKC